MHPDPIVITEAIEGSDDVSLLLDGVQIAIIQNAAGLSMDQIELLAA
jgi:hypothetical protein